MSKQTDAETANWRELHKLSAARRKCLERVDKYTSLIVIEQRKSEQLSMDIKTQTEKMFTAKTNLPAPPSPTTQAAEGDSHDK
jgi:hypothetical protein